MKGLFGEGKKQKTQDTAVHINGKNPNPPIQITIPKRFKMHHNELSKRKILPTRFYDQKACQLLGVDEGVRKVAENFGWLDFLSFKENTYESITLEFLSTVFMHRINEEGEPLECEIKFRLFNQERKLTLTRLNEIFLWPAQNQIYNPEGTPIASYDEQTWWNTIAGYPNFNTRSSHASHIIHPVLRIFMRIMVYACFSKQDSGKLTKEELKCLFIASNFEGIPEGNVNMGYLFILRCIEIREKEEMRGDIKCGGMISIIATELGLGSLLDCLEPVSGSNLLDIKGLSSMKFLVDMTDRVPRYSWKVKDRHYCTLPNPLIQNSVGNSWYIPHEPIEGQVVEEPPEPHHMSTSSILRDGVEHSSSDIENAFNRFNLINQRILEENEYQSYVAQMIYQYQVEKGDFLPYLNYPNRPIQQGPVPGWHNNQPTYPYWQGPHSSIKELRSFPPYDYTQPGGCDFRGDPSFYYTPEVNASSSSNAHDPFRGYYGFPPGYDGGWGDHGVPDFGHYRSRPNYDLPPYVATPATFGDVDPNYNYCPSPDHMKDDDDDQ